MLLLLLAALELLRLLLVEGRLSSVGFSTENDCDVLRLEEEEEVLLPLAICECDLEVEIASLLLVNVGDLVLTGIFKHWPSQTLSLVLQFKEN